MKLRISLTGPALFAGHATSGLRVDEATARDAKGTPYIPGYAIKGAVRAEMERLLNGVVLNKDDRSACGLIDAEEAKRWIDFIFGSPAQQSQIFISNAYPVSVNYSFGVRNGTGINRRLGTVEDQVLFNREILETRIQTFEAEIHFEPELLADDHKCKLLQNTMSSLVALGSDKSRGLGFCSIELASSSLIVTSTSLAETVPALPIENKRVGVLYTLLDPTGISFLADAERQFLPTYQYLPGAALRGAFARALGLRPNTPPSQPEEAAFVDPATALQFSPGWYLSKENGDGTVFPIPSTAQSGKRKPGFIAQDPSNFGVTDTLISGYGLHLMAQTRFPLTPDLDFHRNGQTSPATGFGGFARRGEDGKYYSVQDPPKRVITRVGMTPELATVAENLFYVHEVLDATLTAPLLFYGEITNLSDQTTEYLSRCQQIRIGRARSRGQGRVKVEFVKPRSQTLALSSRLQATTQIVHQTLSHLAQVMPDEPRFRAENRLFFTLTLMSDLVPDLHSRVTAVLSDMPPLPLSWTQGLDIQLEHWAVSMNHRSGWNILTGLPKPVVPALACGSAFLFSGSNSIEQKLCEVLGDLEQNGLGEERTEGFGQVSICHPFHTELAFEAR